MWDTALDNLDIVTFVRAFYLLSALAILAVRFVPPLKDRFLDYGARERQSRRDARSDTSSTSILKVLDLLARLTVSHNRFTDFYILSLLCVAFWVSQIYVDGAFVRLLYRSVPTSSDGSSVTRAAVCFLLFAIHSLRRLYECLTLSKERSSSSMWIGHYAIGLAFYFFTNLAVFVEHIPTDFNLVRLNPLLSPAAISRKPLDWLTVLMFVIESVDQHNHHLYLASLRKYSLPDADAFKQVIAPHYTAECLIYLSLALLDAPRGRFLNRTMLCALIFVVVNLGVTAERTKTWMLDKFPERRNDIQKRWHMVPLLY